MLLTAWCYCTSPLCQVPTRKNWSWQYGLNWLRNHGSAWAMLCNYQLVYGLVPNGLAYIMASFLLRLAITTATATLGVGIIYIVSVTTVTSHLILCSPSHVYTQLCLPWTGLNPTQSTSRPFRPLSSPSHALCSICNAYVSTTTRCCSSLSHTNIADQLRALTIKCKSRNSLPSLHEQAQLLELMSMLAYFLCFFW